MTRASWILGALVAVTLTACGDANRRPDATGGTGAETGAGAIGDTVEATMDTALSDADTGMGMGGDMDTAGDTAAAP